MRSLMQPLRLSSHMFCCLHPGVSEVVLPAVRTPFWQAHVFLVGAYLVEDRAPVYGSHNCKIRRQRRPLSRCFGPAGLPRSTETGFFFPGNSYQSILLTYRSGDFDTPYFAQRCNVILAVAHPLIQPPAKVQCHRVGHRRVLVPDVGSGKGARAACMLCSCPSALLRLSIAVS